MDRISLAFLLCLAIGKPSWGLLLLLLLLLHLKRAKLLQKHVTLSAQTAATGSLWDLSAFIAAGILRAFALKLTLACGFPLCLCFFIPLPSFQCSFSWDGHLFMFMQLHLNVMVMSQLASTPRTPWGHTTIDITVRNTT